MKQGKIRAYILRVNSEGKQYKGYFQEIDNTLKTKQDIVGGLIQVVSLTPEIDVIVNDEGKLRGMPVNRLWLSQDEQPLDILVGNIIVVRHCEDEFVDIMLEDYSIIERLLVPIRKVSSIVKEDGTRHNIIFPIPQSELLQYDGEECKDDGD